MAEALQRGRKIEAIKRLREETGMGLKDAKEAVEAHVQRNPVLAAQAGPRGESSLGRFLLLAALVALAYVAYRFLA